METSNNEEKRLEAAFLAGRSKQSWESFKEEIKPKLDCQNGCDWPNCTREKCVVSSPEGREPEKQKTLGTVHQFVCGFPSCRCEHKFIRPAQCLGYPTIAKTDTTDSERVANILIGEIKKDIAKLSEVGSESAQEKPTVENVQLTGVYTGRIKLVDDEPMTRSEAENIAKESVVDYPSQPETNIETVKRNYFTEHCYGKDWGVYYSDDGSLIKTAFHGTEQECRNWIKNEAN